MNYYEHHLGDYVRDTAHLSAVEDGIYRRLLDAYYIREKPLPIDVRECCKLARAVSKVEKLAVTYVLGAFFCLSDGGHRQARADAEIARFQDKQRKAKASADKRWADANASADAMRTHSEGNANGMHRAPVPSPQSPDSTHEKDKPSRSAARGSRLAHDWVPGDSGYAYAAREGLTNGRAAAELENFRDHWTAKAGKDAVKADWQAAWRTWVRKSIEFARPGSPTGEKPWDGAQ